MSWATNQSLYKIHTGRGGVGEWQFPMDMSAWLESTQLPCQYPPAHQVIQYTYTLWVHVPPLVSVEEHTLMGFLRGYKETEEGVGKEWEAQVQKNSLHTTSLCFTSIKGLVTTDNLKKYVICTRDRKYIILNLKKLSFTQISMAFGINIYKKTTVFAAKTHLSPVLS